MSNQADANKNPKTGASNANPPAAEVKPQENEVKLKTIAQRKPIPAKKEDLIQYLVERLQQAEDAISDTQRLLLEEKKKQAELMKELDEQTQQLNILLENEKQSLSDKVQVEIKQTLETAVLAKVKAEEEKKIETEKLTQRNYLINELNDQIFTTRKDYKNLGMQFNELLSEHQQAKMKILELENQKQNLIQDNNNKDFQLKKTQRELQDSNNVIAKLTDVRNVLNRVHNNDILKVPGQSSQGFTQPAVINNYSGLDTSTHNRGLSGSVQNNQSQYGSKDQVDSSPNGLRGTGVKKPDYMTNQQDFWFSAEGDQKQNNQTNFPGKISSNEYSSQY